MLWSPLGSHQVGVVDLEWLEPGHEAILGQTDPKKVWTAEPEVRFVTDK